MHFQYQPHHFKTRLNNGKQKLWDVVRRKYVAITPEELVRQHLIRFLMTEKEIPLNKIAVEKLIVVNDLPKRFDVLVYDTDFKPLLLAECKAPQIKLNQQTLNQVANYNQTLAVPYLLITNGIEIHLAHIDFEKKQFAWMNEMPVYTQLKQLTNH